LFNFISQPIYLLIYSCILISLVLYLSKISTTLRAYIKEKNKEIWNTEMAMNEMITKLREQLKFLKMQQNINKNDISC
jgi:hypothetical protein